MISRGAGSGGVRFLVLLVVATSCAGSCATFGDGTIEIIERPAPPRAPVIAVTASNESKPGATCGVQPELARGSPPNDARVIVQLEMTSDRPEDTRAFEETARLHALQRCATGISVLRAIAEGRGYTSVTVALWEKVTAAAP